jgi:hypothetical protein
MVFVDLPEPGDIDGEGVAVVDRPAEQMLVFQGAEEPSTTPLVCRA